MLFVSITCVSDSFILFYLLLSEPESGSFQCNPFDNVGGSISSVLTGAAFTIIAVCWSTIRMSTKGNDLLEGGTGATSIQDREEVAIELLICTPVLANPTLLLN